MENIYAVINEMQPMSIEDLEVFDLKGDRVDVIIPAGKIYQTALEAAVTDKILVPKIVLADGMVYHMSKMMKFQ